MLSFDILSKHEFRVLMRLSIEEGKSHGKDALICTCFEQEERCCIISFIKRKSKINSTDKILSKSPTLSSLLIFVKVAIKGLKFVSNLSDTEKECPTPFHRQFLCFEFKCVDCDKRNLKIAVIKLKRCF